MWNKTWFKKACYFNYPATSLFSFSCTFCTGDLLWSWSISYISAYSFGFMLCLPLHLSLNHKGCWDNTDDFTTSFLHFFSLFFTALLDLANSRPIHSLMLASHLFFCLPCRLPPCHFALQDGFGQTLWTGDMSTPLQLHLFYDGQEVTVWSDWLLDLGTNFLVGNMVFFWDVSYLL